MHSAPLAGALLLLGFVTLLNGSRGVRAQNQSDSATCQFPNSTTETRIEACSRLLERVIRESATKQAVVLTARAQAWNAKGDVNRAFQDLSDAIQLDENFLPALEARADMLRDNDQCNEAIPSYDKILSLQPQHAGTLISRSLCLIQKNEIERARADLDQALKFDENNASGFAELALDIRSRLNIATGNLEKALADAAQAIKLNPHRVSLYINRGNIWGDQRDFDKAFADYDRAIELDPDNSKGSAADAWRLKGRLHLLAGDVDRAIADFDASIKLDPHRSDSYSERASVLSSKGDETRARADYDKAIEIDPHSATAFIARGDFYRAKGEYDLALKDYTTAIQKKPHDLLGYSNRALVHFYKGDFALAANDLKRVSDTQNNAYPMLLLYLSRMRASGANPRDARAELSKSALKLNANEWPYPVVEFYIGRKSAEAALAAAKTPGELCVAHFYLGESHLSRNARSAAIKAFENATNGCPKDFIEYRASLEELKRLR